MFWTVDDMVSCSNAHKRKEKKKYSQSIRLKTVSAIVVRANLMPSMGCITMSVFTVEFNGGSSLFSSFLIEYWAWVIGRTVQVQWNSTIRIACIFNTMQPNCICYNKIQNWNILFLFSHFMMWKLMLYRLYSAHCSFPWSFVILHLEHSLHNCCYRLPCIHLLHIQWCIPLLLDDFLAKYNEFHAIHPPTFS